MTLPECEAERRIKMALYEIELMWGSGKVDLGQIRGTLRGEHCAEHHEEKVAGLRHPTSRASGGTS